MAATDDSTVFATDVLGGNFSATFLGFPTSMSVSLASSLGLTYDTRREYERIGICPLQ